MTTSTGKAVVERSTAEDGLRLSHEEAATLIMHAGERHCATPATAKTLLQRVGILDAAGVLAQRFR